MLRGWGNYFSLSPGSKGYRAVDAHTRCRLRQWLRHKHQRKRTYPDDRPLHLEWTHAQFIRLAFDIAAGRLLEQPSIVAERYLHRQH
jgi:hypothetical protein